MDYKLLLYESDYEWCLPCLLEQADTLLMSELTPVSFAAVGVETALDISRVFQGAIIILTLVLVFALFLGGDVVICMLVFALRVRALGAELAGNVRWIVR